MSAFLILIIAFATSACDLPRAQGFHVQETPERLDDGWEVSSPGAEGLNASAIATLRVQIAEGEFGRVHSCLIVKNGALVYEEYFHGFHRDKLHRLYSVTKSVTSALIGIAIGQGLITDVNEPVVSFFPEYVDQGWDHRKDAITLEHLLTMSAGLRYDEHSYPYSDSRNSHTQMTATRDWMRWALEQPLVAEPGTRFTYSTANSHLFSGIIYKTTGVYANQFAEEYLFDPLGITEYFWTVGDGFPATGGSFGGLKLRPRDMAKFGYLYLNGGRWKGLQIVPLAWTQESLSPRITAWGDARYGYQWWMHQLVVGGQAVKWFAARGHGDQLIALFPALDMVVVFTCGNEGAAGGLDQAISIIAQAALTDTSQRDVAPDAVIGVAAES